MASAAFMIYKTIRQGAAPTISTEISEDGPCNLVVFGMPAKLGDYMPDCFLSMKKHLKDPNIEIVAFQKAELLKTAVNVGLKRFLCIIIPPEMMKDKMVAACKGVCPEVPVFGYGNEPKGRYQRDVDSYGAGLDAPCLHGPGVLRGNKGLWKPSKFSELVEMAKRLRNLHSSQEQAEVATLASSPSTAFHASSEDFSTMSEAPLIDMGTMPGMGEIKAAEPSEPLQYTPSPTPSQQLDPACMNSIANMMEMMKVQIMQLERMPVDGLSAQMTIQREVMMQTAKQQMEQLELQMHSMMASAQGVSTGADVVQPLSIDGDSLQQQPTPYGRSDLGIQPTAGTQADCSLFDGTPFNQILNLLLAEAKRIRVEIESFKHLRRLENEGGRSSLRPLGPAGLSKFSSSSSLTCLDDSPRTRRRSTDGSWSSREIAFGI